MESLQSSSFPVVVVVKVCQKKQQSDGWRWTYANAIETEAADTIVNTVTLFFGEVSQLVDACDGLLSDVVRGDQLVLNDLHRLSRGLFHELLGLLLDVDAQRP